MDNWQWKLRGEVATLLEADADGGDSSTLDLTRPSTGIVGLAGSEQGVLCLTPSVEAAAGAAGDLPQDELQLGELRLADAYLRGRDLIARYSPTEAFPFRTELYWRLPSPEATDDGLTLIVSVETDLLDTQPTLLVRSSLPGDAAVAIDDQGALSSPDAAVAAVAELASGAWCEALHPSDRSEGSLELDSPADGRIGIRWRLFSRFLEKGVIRRARLAAALLPENEPTERKRFIESFAAQAPPLTV